MNHASRERRLTIATLGLLQILSWGSTFYLLAVLGPAITADTGWPLGWVVGGVSLALLIAGLLSSSIGKAIQALDGWRVLAAGSTCLALGLALVASSSFLFMYLVGWAVLGCGMAAGLYDPAFATLGKLYGRDARPMIAAVTLYGGFASTVCWPLTALLLDHFGWRGACAAYAALHVVIGLPACLWRAGRVHEVAAAAHTESAASISELPPEQHVRALLLLGMSLTISAAILSMISVHLLALLQARGMTLPAAVALGALIGPAQVGARVLELVFGRGAHPLRTMFGGVVLVAAGVATLGFDWPLAAAALIIYGAGNGIGSIVRGTVPLVLFGSTRYPLLMGKLGAPILIAMAVAPAIGALLVQHGGAALTLGVVGAIASANVFIVFALMKFQKS